MGRLLKLNRVLPPHRKGLTVAMDQPRAIYSGALADPGQVLDNLRTADVDAFLMTLATAKRYEERLNGRPVVISVSQDYQDAARVVEQIVAFGGDALKYEVYPYSDRETFTMRGLEALVVHADRWGLPVMAEVVPGGFDDVEVHTSTNLRDSVRRAAEAGADLAKIPPPSSGSLREITEYASVPVLLLGGARKGTMEDALARVRDLGSQVDGLVFGRYVVEDPKPADVVAALREALDAAN